MGAETDFRAELPSFDAPTLLIHGDADASAPIEITGRKTVALLPRARLIELPGAGHGLYVTHAPQIVDEAAKFVGLGGLRAPFGGQLGGLNPADSPAGGGAHGAGVPTRGMGAGRP